MINSYTKKHAKTDRTMLVDFQDIQPGNGAGLFLQPESLHGAFLEQWSNFGQMLFMTLPL